jgi:hypothetical protein
MSFFQQIYRWLTTPMIKKTVPPKSTTQDYFERRLRVAAPGSHAEMDFNRDLSGQFKSRKTQQAYRQFSMAPVQDQSSDNFILSMMVAYATDSSIMGYAVGGSLVGGLVGSSLASGRKSETQTPSQREDATPAPSDTPWYAANNDSDTTRSTSRSGGISWTNSDDSCRAPTPSPTPDTYYSPPSPSPEPSPSPSSDSSYGE